MLNQNFSKFLNKGISTPIGIFIIVLVAVIAGGVMVWQSGRLLEEEVKVLEEKEKIKTAGNETTNLSGDEVLRDWKTYRNEKYGFEFKYPQNEDFIIFPPEYESILFNGRTSFWEFRLRIWDNPKILSLAEYLINVHYIIKIDPSSKEKILSMLNKEKIGDIEYFGGIWGYPAEFTLRDQYIFEFLSNHYEEEFDQMLSTFRFLE